MANILGIDFGLAKIGLAYASGPLAAPLKVMRYKKTTDVLPELARLVLEDHIERVVIGVSDGEIGRASRKFGSMLSGKLALPVVYVDETLSTQDVANMTLAAGMKRIKRKRMEDAFSATLILQNYLDNLIG